MTTRELPWLGRLRSRLARYGCHLRNSDGLFRVTVLSHGDEMPDATPIVGEVKENGARQKE